MDAQCVYKSVAVNNIGEQPRQKVKCDINQPHFCESILLKTIRNKKAPRR